MVTPRGEQLPVTLSGEQLPVTLSEVEGRIGNINHTRVPFDSAQDDPLSFTMSLFSCQVKSG